MTETLLFGFNPKVYHSTNIILFILSIWLMYVFLLKLNFNKNSNDPAIEKIGKKQNQNIGGVSHKTSINNSTKSIDENLTTGLNAGLASSLMGEEGNNVLGAYNKYKKYSFISSYFN